MPNQSTAHFEYDDENVMHRRALAAAILASLTDADVVTYHGECELTSEAEMRLVQVLAMAGCSREECGAAMRLEGKCQSN